MSRRSALTAFWFALAATLSLVGVISCTKEPEARNRPAFVAMVAVTGDSMQPTFGTHEIVAVELCRFEEVAAGETVIYWHDGIRGYIHHRTVARDQTGRWLTAGDNNPGLDRGHMTRDEFVGRTQKLLR